MKREFYQEKKDEGKLRQGRSFSDDRLALDEQDKQTTRVAGYNMYELKLEDVKGMLISEGIAERFMGIIGEGKEANVYWIENPDGKFQAAKLFRVYHTTHKA
ncbi:MAG: hypothetical protein ACXAD7_09840, partial [Candidatus Kariarchaeaceae archaeon]